MDASSPEDFDRVWNSLTRNLKATVVEFKCPRALPVAGVNSLVLALRALDRVRFVRLIIEGAVVRSRLCFSHVVLGLLRWYFA
jgi:hypothetical protein